ncbi:hypothetical protein QU487_06460 [Crenobacter sp. SG2305]|uniref:AcrVA2 family anti-CRISPR protein n=1 Tax=Crenobacter oryzisoli TaxID=3056844 RepID=UPI0025AA3B4C|nr:hypothetical protein [Crenobacter sp. SG2305]MDN0082395.1 hypothetical protein [Crenobacter sp. SG2305]
MTQTLTHPARDRLEAFSRLPIAADVYAAIEQTHLREQIAEPCYLNEEVTSKAIIEAIERHGGREALTQLRSSGPLALALIVSAWCTLATWRMTQGIYRFDPALYRPLIETPLSGDLPADVLLRLPEWCVYIETPDLEVPRRDGRGDSPLNGAWARISREPDGTPTLTIGLDIPGDDGFTHQHLPLRGTLDSSIQFVLDTWGEHDPAASPIIRSYLEPIINLLLYLCSEAPDIAGKGQPANPEPKRTRRDGWKLFPASGPKKWDVGVRVGAALRKAYHEAETGQGDGSHAGPRPHIRRAHWHGFRSGPKTRDDGSEIPTIDRKFDLRWLPPIPVKLTMTDDLPAVIRNVKP